MGVSRQALVGSLRGSSGSTGRLADAELREIEREVLRHLYDSFGGSLGDSDFEDLTQEALAELHRHMRGSEGVREPRALAKRIAWRRARDTLRDRRARPEDPQSELFLTRPDSEPDQERRLVAKAELARALEAAERLSAKDQAVYRSRFVEEAKPQDVCRRLGLDRREYYTCLHRAIAKVEQTLAPGRYDEIQRDLLSAVIAGSASAAEVRRARRLVRYDPVAAALARELRELHQGTAALLPAPAVEALAEPSLGERLSSATGWLRERLTPGAEQAALEQAPQAGLAGRAGGAALGGAAAKLGLVGGAGKLALGCLGAGAITAVCMVSGIGIPELGEATPDRHRTARDPAATVGYVVPDRALAASKEAEANASPASRPAKSASPGGDEWTPEESVSPAVSASAPPAEQEFGVAAAAPAPSPAAAPGGAASSQDVQQEFGP